VPAMKAYSLDWQSFEAPTWGIYPDFLSDCCGKMIRIFIKASCRAYLQTNLFEDPARNDWNISHDGSMVLLYMVCHGSHQYTPVMLAYIPAPWILWVLKPQLACGFETSSLQAAKKPTILQVRLGSHGSKGTVRNLCLGPAKRMWRSPSNKNSSI
jgi:hypothetical protein